MWKLTLLAVKLMVHGSHLYCQASKFKVLEIKTEKGIFDGNRRTYR